MPSEHPGQERERQLGINKGASRKGKQELNRRKEMVHRGHPKESGETDGRERVGAK